MCNLFFLQRFCIVCNIAEVKLFPAVDFLLQFFSCLNNIFALNVSGAVDKHACPVTHLLRVIRIPAHNLGIVNVGWQIDGGRAKRHQCTNHTGIERLFCKRFEFVMLAEADVTEYRIEDFLQVFIQPLAAEIVKSMERNPSRGLFPDRNARKHILDFCRSHLSARNL